MCKWKCLFIKCIFFCRTLYCCDFIFIMWFPLTHWICQFLLSIQCFVYDSRILNVALKYVLQWHLGIGEGDGSGFADILMGIVTTGAAVVIPWRTWWRGHFHALSTAAVARAPASFLEEKHLGYFGRKKSSSVVWLTNKNFQQLKEIKTRSRSSCGLPCGGLSQNQTAAFPGEAATLKRGWYDGKKSRGGGSTTGGDYLLLSLIVVRYLLWLISNGDMQCPPEVFTGRYGVGSDRTWKNLKDW